MLKHRNTDVGADSICKSDDPFFNSLKEDYPGFIKWFNQKANEKVYVTWNEENNAILSLLYIKKEETDEVYSDIRPTFSPKKRLKIGTFKIVSNGVKLGERFLKIIFDNALLQKVDEIYVTIFNRTDEQKRLISLLEDWGFHFFGEREMPVSWYMCGILLLHLIQLILKRPFRISG